MKSERRPVRLHRGDIMSVEKRSALMSRIRGKGTKPEFVVAEILRSLGMRPETHVRDLPGCPDFVLRKHRLVLFVDGDFWHGWRFPAWRLKLSEKWEKKPMLRMLQVEELQRAMGFPGNHRFEHGSRRDKIKMLGNGVSPPVMASIVETLAA